MLKILTKNHFFLQRKLVKGFGSVGPVNVVLDKDAKWIKYNTSKKLACVDGIEDIHYRHPQYLPDDPYAHLRNESYFSFNRLFFNDPWFHEPAHELYADEIHGYVLGDDPNDMRYDMFIPAVTTALLFLGGVSFYIVVTLKTANQTHLLHDATHLERKIDDVLSEKANRIAQLEEEVRQIKEK